MIVEQIKTKTLRIAEQKPEGFTFDPFTGRVLSRGYVVASARTQDCFGKAGLHRVIKFCLAHRNYCVGGWKNEEGLMQFDASMVYDNIEDAINAAVSNGQRAIFNLYTGREITARDYRIFATCILAA